MSSNKVRRITTSQVATFGTAAPTNGSTFVHIPALNFPEPTIEVQRDSALIGNNRAANSPDWATVQRFAYAFQTQLWTGTKGFDGAGSDADPTSFYLQSMWESYFGAAATTTTSTTVAATSGAGRTADLKVASTTGWAAGMGIMVNGEIRFITNVTSGTAATLNADLSTTPALNDVVYGGWNLSCTLGTRTKYEYINVEKDGHGWLGGPGQVMSAKLSGFASGQGLRVDMGFEGNTFAAGLTPTTFAKNPFTGNPLIAKSAQLVMDTVATQAFADASVDFGLEKEWQPATTAAQGRQGVEIVGQGKGQVTLQTFYDATSWSRHQDLVNFPVMLAAMTGSTNAQKARGGIGIFMPCAQVSTAEAAIQNQVGNSTTLTACDPAESAVTVISTAALAGTIKPMHLFILGGV